MADKDRAGIPASKRSRRKRETLSWANAPVQTLRTAIGVLTDNGCAVLFGRTMDGSALMFQVLNGKDKYKEYITTYGDIVPVLAECVEDVLDVQMADLVEEADK